MIKARCKRNACTLFFALLLIAEIYVVFIIGWFHFKFCVNALSWYKIQSGNRVCEPQVGLHTLFAS